MTSAIETEELTKRYGSARGIEALDLVVQPGEVFGFLGPNGSGSRPRSARSSTSSEPPAGRARSSVSTPHADSVGRTAARRLSARRPRPVRPDDRADHLVRGSSRPAADTTRRSTADIMDRLPVTIDRPVRELSKGNRQKVGLLLAFMHRPDCSSSTSRPPDSIRWSRPSSSSCWRRRQPKVARSCCPRTPSTRCSGSPIGWPSSATAGWWSPTPSSTYGPMLPAS